MDITDLRKIGLTQGEGRLYDALLELGESTRTELAKKSGISPSKIYDVANRLIEKGIISCVTKNGIIHFAAADPEKLRDFLNHKEQELEKQKQLVEQILPSLLLKYKKTEENVDVEVFYGWEGMKTVFDKIVKSLDEGDCNYVFGASRGYDSKQADIFFSQYYQKKRKKGFATKVIFNSDLRQNKQRISIFNEKPNEMKFLYQETFTEINLYKDTVLVIMLLKRPIVLRVKSQDTADSFKKFFDSLWQQAQV